MIRHRPGRRGRGTALAVGIVAVAMAGLAACGGSDDGTTTTAVAYRVHRCADVGTWAAAQAALTDGTGDPRGLDVDGDGVACSIELGQDEYAKAWAGGVAASCTRIFARAPGRALVDAGGHTWAASDCTAADPGPRGWTPLATGDPAADGAADAAESACRSFFALAGPRLKVPETGALLTAALCPRRPRTSTATTATSPTAPSTTTVTTGTAPTPTDTATTVPGSVTVTLPPVTATAPATPAPAPTPTPTPTPPTTTTRAAVPPLPPEARASDCTATVGGHRIAVVRTGGSVICSGALALWDSYAKLAPTRGQGSSAGVDLYGWHCAAGAATSRREGGCSNTTRSGSFDVYRLS